MYWNDCLRLRSYRRLNLRGIDIVRSGIDIHEHRLRSQAMDAADGSEECKRRGDYFVPGPDLQAHHRIEQRVRPARNTYRITALSGGGRLALEISDLGASDTDL